ncbi:hypothetical protein, partial [Acinetobacter towneri]|uniref:hypothetical protein n=1 Tax=Acinetobacter towneri TaxID=202956 RepID=UPI002935F5C4
VVVFCVSALINTTTFFIFQAIIIIYFNSLSLKLARMGLNVDLKKINIELFQISPKENSDAFHNRYVLSELGGIHLGHGIDLSNKPNQKDHLSIIKDDIYMEMCCMYEEELEENFQIVGKESIN